jgi:wyosine [tRNA(Phe)-imidazoG37] synthetase (radical SAM superfamily)
MNKKAKKRIFDAVMATKPEHCQNPKHEQMVKKLILMITSFKHRRHGRTWTEEEMIKSLSYDSEEAKRWQRTPEQIEDDIHLERSVGLMCGNKNA